MQRRSSGMPCAHLVSRPCVLLRRSVDHQSRCRGREYTPERVATSWTISATTSEKYRLDPSICPEYRHTGRLRVSRRSHMTKLFPFARVVTPGLVGTVTLCVCLHAQTSAQDARRQPAATAASASAAAAVTPASSRALIDRYCVTCHNERLK